MGRSPAFYRDKFARAWQALAPQRTNQEIINILKNPFCVGVIREDLLRILEQRANRRFADLWDMATWMRQNRPDLDLTTPPLRNGA
jgi:hypothetical protein